MTGLIAHYPIGGVTWDYIQYPLGLARLGHDVTYLEDPGAWPYDPRTDGTTTDPSGNVRYLAAMMARFGLSGRWSYRIDQGGGREAWYGLPGEEVARRLASCDLFLNVSGACYLRELHLAARRRAYVDSDPAFTQLALARGDPAAVRQIRGHDRHFSFGERVGTPECPLPTGGVDWRPTRQPIVLEAWAPAPPPASDSPFTTVMNWTSYAAVEHAGQRYGQKDVEFLKILDLPSRCPGERFAPAIGGGPGARRPDGLLTRAGWHLVDTRGISADPDRYRDFLARSKGEVSVAKEGYVAARTGWFSCRSACYLALGRPVILEDTGFSRVLPTGRGLFAFRDVEEAAFAVRAVSRDWASHSRAARRLAETAFDAGVVLTRLVEEAAP